MAIVLENLIDLDGLNRFLVRSKEIFKEKLKYTTISDEYITWSILPGQVYKIFLTCPDRYEHEINCSEEIVLGSTYNVDCDFVEMRAIKSFGNAKTANPWVYYTADETGAVVYLRNPFYSSTDPAYSECCICVVDVRSDTVIDDIEGYSGDLSNYSKCVIESVSGPIMKKTWAPYTCASTTEGKARLGLFEVIPTSDNFNDPWYVHYRIKVVTATTNCQLEADCIFSQAGANTPYHIFNTLPSTTYAIYNHEIYYHNTAAMYANRKTYPVVIGVRVQSASAANTLARTYTIEILDYSGCEIKLLDSIITQDSFYSTTNYKLVELNATTNGLQETSDTDTTVSYGLRDYYYGFQIHSPATPLFNYKICGFDQESRLVPVIRNNIAAATVTSDVDVNPVNVPMVVSKGMIYYHATTQILDWSTRTASYISYWTLNTAGWHQYNFPVKPNVYVDIYLAGSYNSKTDEFTLDTTDKHSYYAFVVSNEFGSKDPSPYCTNPFKKGYFYWYVGYSTYTAGVAAFTQHHPLFYYDGERLRPVTPGMDIPELHTVDVEVRTRELPVKNSGIARINSVKGNTVTWNQLVKNPDFSEGTTNWELHAGGSGISVNSDGHLVLACSNGASSPTIRQALYTVNRHKYYVHIRFRINSSTSGQVLGRAGYFGGTNTMWISGEYNFNKNEWIELKLTAMPTSNNPTLYVGMYASAAWAVTGDTIEFDYINLIDLTKMFGFQSEHSIQEIDELYPVSKGYYRYYDSGSNGTRSVLSGSVGPHIGQGVVCGVGQSTQITGWSGSGTSQFKDMFPRGLCATRTVRDEITPTQLTKRVHAIRLKDLTWGKYNNTGVYSCSNWSGSVPFDINRRTAWGCLYSTKYPCSASAYGDSIYVGSTGILYILDQKYQNKLADFTASLATDDVWLYYEMKTPVTASWKYPDNNFRTGSFSDTDKIEVGTVFIDSGSNLVPTAPAYVDIDYECNTSAADMSAPSDSSKHISNKVGGYYVKSDFSWEYEYFEPPYPDNMASIDGGSVFKIGDHLPESWPDRESIEEIYKTYAQVHGYWNSPDTSCVLGFGGTGFDYGNYYTGKIHYGDPDYDGHCYFYLSFDGDDPLEDGESVIEFEYVSMSDTFTYTDCSDDGDRFLGIIHPLSVKFLDSNVMLKTGATMTGNLNMGSKKITSLATPTANTDAATKKYVDDQVGNIATLLAAI